jgi:hypothetical protein
MNERRCWRRGPIANPAVIRPNLRPGRAYMQHLLAGRDFLSAGYYAWLCSIECVDD